MKIARKQLLRAAEECAVLTSEKSPEPSFRMIRVATHAGSLRMSVSPMSVGCSTTVGECADKIDVAVSGKALLSAVRAMHDGEVSLEYDKTLTVKSGRRKVVLDAIDGSELPPAESPPEGGYAVSCETLSTLLNATAYAAGQQIERAHLAGVRLRMFDGNLHANSTDGHRMAHAWCEFSCSEDFNLWLPNTDANLVATLVKWCASDEREMVKIASDGVRLFAMFSDGDVLFARTPEVNEIPYDNVTPKPDDKAPRLETQTEHFLSCIGAAIQIGGNDASIDFESADGCLRISIAGADTFSDEIEAQVKGKVHFQTTASYMADAIKRLDSDTFSMRSDGELDPVVIEAPGRLAIVMPRRM